MKYCSKCKTEKYSIPEYFYRSKNTKDGLHNWCISCVKEYNKIHKKRYHKNYYSKSENKKHHNEYQKIYSSSEERKIIDKKYWKEYRNKFDIRKHRNEYSNNYIKTRKEKDINFRLAHLLRHRTYLAIKRGKKLGSSVKDVGCSLLELKEYLESKFKPGMNWNNQGQWHIDHIKPLSSFNLENREEFLEACNYKNLQPLWEQENLQKSNKILS